MKNYFLLILLSFYSLASQAQNNYQNKILSDTRKATCSQEEIASLSKELDGYSNEFSALLEKLLEISKNIKDEKAKKAEMDKIKPALNEQTSRLYSKKKFLMDNCGFKYKSPKTRDIEERYAKEREEKAKQYDPAEAYTPN